MVARQQLSLRPLLPLLLLVTLTHSFVLRPHQSSPISSSLAAETANDGSTAAAGKLEKAESVASLVDDDEWDGVTMELTTAVTKSIMDSVQRNTKSFVGKDEYKVGDITREIDARMKKAVAKLRGKEGYEVGDLVAYVTEKGIAVAEQATGTKLDKYKDISESIDKQVKSTVASYVGEENYKSGALAAAVATKVKGRLGEFAEHYDLDQVAKELVTKRKVWAKKYLGEEFVDHFTWTDLAKKVTGKEDYHVGDVSKKVLQEAKNMLGIGKPPKGSSKPAATSSTSGSAPPATTETIPSPEDSSASS